MPSKSLRTLKKLSRFSKRLTTKDNNEDTDSNPNNNQSQLFNSEKTEAYATAPLSLRESKLLTYSQKTKNSKLDLTTK